MSQQQVSGTQAVKNGSITKPKIAFPLNYTHEQSTASDTWTINHNLGFRPWGIHVVDYQGNTYAFFPIDHIDINSLTLSFGYSLSGFAYLS